MRLGRRLLSYRSLRPTTSSLHFTSRPPSLATTEVPSTIPSVSTLTSSPVLDAWAATLSPRCP